MKKGVAVHTAMTLIMGIIFLIVVVYILMTTGLLSSFTERFGVMVCTGSALARGEIVRIIWSVTKWVVPIMYILEFLAFGPSVATKTSARLAGKSLLRAILAGGAAGLLTGLAFLSLAQFVTYVISLKIFPLIPLVCPVLVIDAGYSTEFTTPTAFFEAAGSRTVDCWDMMGEGRNDPIWGVDPPNPRTCFILKSYVAPFGAEDIRDKPGKFIDNRIEYDPVTVRDLYESMKTTYKDDWKFGTEKIYVYCDGEDMGDDYLDWDDPKCNIVNSHLYIMYFDKHDNDLFSYGSAACDIEDKLIGGGVTKNDHDTIVWCVEDIPVELEVLV